MASIFVNPASLSARRLDALSTPLERDVQLCQTERIDLVFHPEVATIYPAGFKAGVEVGELSNLLEGASRPGHFRGVATVVLKLFNIVQPDVAYFGQKDAQQCRVLQQHWSMT